MGNDTENLREALEHLQSGDFMVGPDWEKAHDICQAHEGETAFDWVHALCHRIEGDEGNAGYWYRRAGRQRHPGPVEEEWRAILRTVAPTT